jgi:Na+/H+-dicarboxylate symporter
MNLPLQMFLSLISGLATGVLLGGITASLQWIGDAYIHLLQMTALPYGIIVLIARLGKVKCADAVDLALRAGGLFAVIGPLALVVSCVLSVNPISESASFFNNLFGASPQQANFLESFPRDSSSFLMDKLVPAVLLFNIAVGLAVIGIAKELPLLAAFACIEIFVKPITKLIWRLNPIAIFAFAASSAGTLGIDDRAYLHQALTAFRTAISLMAVCAIVTFLILHRGRISRFMQFFARPRARSHVSAH